MLNFKLSYCDLFHCLPDASIAWQDFFKKVFPISFVQVIFGFIWLSCDGFNVNHNSNFVSICVVWNSRSLIFLCNKQKREIVWSMNVWKLQSNLIWGARSQAKFCSLVPFFHFGFPLFAARSQTYVHLPHLFQTGIPSLFHVKHQDMDGPY